MSADLSTLIIQRVMRDMLKSIVHHLETCAQSKVSLAIRVFSCASYIPLKTRRLRMDRYQHGVKTREFKDDRTVEKLETFIDRYASRIEQVSNDTLEQSASPVEAPPKPLVIQPRRFNTEGQVLVLNASTIDAARNGDLGPTFIKLCVSNLSLTWFVH